MIVSGRDGGKDLNLRAFGRDGVHLLGRLLYAEGSTLTFSSDVANVLDEADTVAADLQAQIDRYIDEHDLDAPATTVEPIDWTPGTTPTQVDLEAVGVNSVIWATGYHYDFSWIDADVFGPRGYPNQHRGVTSEPGLYFIGLNGMHTVGSGLFFGVGGDAQHIADHIALDSQ
jgi:putative flavoprotein involved in K+ transport